MLAKKYLDGDVELPELAHTNALVWRFLAEYAMAFARRNQMDLFDTLLDINETIFGEYQYQQGSTNIATTPFEVYAKRRGVHLVGHHETGCAVSHYERQLGAALDLYARLGVDAVKTGYVCDAGQIQRQDVPGGEVRRTDRARIVNR